MTGAEPHLLFSAILQAFGYKRASAIPPFDIDKAEPEAIGRLCIGIAIESMRLGMKPNVNQIMHLSDLYAVRAGLVTEQELNNMRQQAMQQQINIVPGVVFGEQQEFSRYIRINTGVPLNARIEQALHTLASLISV